MLYIFQGFLVYFSGALHYLIQIPHQAGKVALDGFLVIGLGLFRVFSQHIQHHAGGGMQFLMQRLYLFM